LTNNNLDIMLINEDKIMKEFDEWWKTYHQEWGLNEHYAKEGWRAALECVNNMLWLASGQVADEVKERIKKELENN